MSVRVSLLVATGFALGGLIAGALVAATPPRVGLADDPAARAAAEIMAAQRLADEAAGAWVEAAERLEELETTLAETQQRRDDTLAETARLTQRLETAVVERFMDAAVSPMPLLTGWRGPTDEAQAAVFMSVVSTTSVDDLDDLVALREDLEALTRRSEAERRSLEAAQDDLEARRIEAERRVLELQAAEAQRLRDAAVQQALAAARLAEQRTVAVASDGVTVRQMAAGVVGGPGWICPVAGTTAFADTWGAPRPGDRRHLGVDFISPRGTPLVAVVSGIARSGTNRLGGNVVYLEGNDGHRYYYAHLDRWGLLGPVRAGDVIGYVGDTGNAIGIPHLHFEIRPGGGPNVNPYPTVRAFC